MGLLILIAFISVPMIEIGLFVQVGGAIGLWPTLFIVVATAVAGTALLRHQGLSALTRLQQSLERGEAPLDPVFDGFCLLAAGILLLTPGFFTDTIGFALFIPPVRRALRRIILSKVQIHTPPHGYNQSNTQSDPSGANPWSQQTRPDFRPDLGGGPVIDGDWQDVTDEDSTPKLSKDDDSRSKRH
jgi:UPF0716 protein FxsA